nr:reverse transcriptase domain-containing protein [Tanacetum cinerariifolium]
MMEVFMDDFSIFGNSFGTCLSYLDKMLKRCEDTNLCLNWEKSHFMVKEGIVLGHKISKNGMSDRGTHFCNDQFAKVMLKYGVTHRLATAYHPETSEQVEVSNRGLKTILERTVGENRASWLDKLDDALWAFRTAFKTPIRDHIFNVGDRVILFNSKLKIFSIKLKTRWTGPFTVTQVFPYGTVELSQTDGPNFKVNGHRLNHYFGEDIPPMVVSDLQTFPKDK